MGWYGLDRSGSGYGTVKGSCEHGDEPLDSIKCWEVLEWLHNWQLLKKGTVYTVCRTPWTGDQAVARPQPTHRTAQTQNKRIQTSMTRVGFEPTVPAFERAKIVHALDGAGTVIGVYRQMVELITIYWN
jgi:hypothetical protein